MDPLSLMIMEMKKDMREMDRKIDELLEFRWKIVGGSIMVSGFVAIVFQMIHLIWGYR